MRTLIIPDLHHHMENAERWFATQGFERAIFLGDFFDDFGDGLEDAKHTALWLRNRIESAPADVFLLGDPLLGAGRDRFGPQPIGGPLWLDWSSLIPISGINQVVGHTPDNRVREKSAPGSKNYCLDVRNGEAAAMLENGKITVLNKGDA